MKTKFHPAIAPELDKISAVRLQSLAKVAAEGKCTLVLGAGVSASAGLPSWKELLQRIVSTYLTHWEFENSEAAGSVDKPPHNLSIAFWENFFWSKETRDQAKHLVANEDMLSLAQMVKSRIRDIDWLYLLRKCLYGGAPLPPVSPLQKAIAEFCATDVRRIEVLSYNYDGLIEIALRAQGLRSSILWSPECRRKPGATPIYYPHGYLKHDGGPTCPVILAEEDYYGYSTDQYGWRNTVQLNALLSSTCVFLGSSLTDPQTRRLLWIAKRTGHFKHYAFLPAAKREDVVAKRLEALVDSRLRDLNLFTIRYPPDSNHGLLVLLLQRVVQAQRPPRAAGISVASG